jgi:hypothetical protein
MNRALERLVQYRPEDDHFLVKWQSASHESSSWVSQSSLPDETVAAWILMGGRSSPDNPPPPQKGFFESKIMAKVSASATSPAFFKLASGPVPRDSYCIASRLKYFAFVRIVFVSLWQGQPELNR